MIPMTIRPALPGDVPALHALVESAYRGESARRGWSHEADLLEGQRTDRESLLSTLADPHETILLAFEDDVLIGCVQIGLRGAGTAYLGLLAITPGRQAAGLGRRLIAEAEGLARGRGVTRIEMTVIRQRAALIAYYERRGYVRTGEERPFPMDDPRFGVPMRRDLAFAVLDKPL